MELLAIQLGLQVACGRNLSHLVVSSYCKKIVEDINSNTLIDGIYSDIVLDCRELRHYFQVVTLRFTRREDNHVADALAKEYKTHADYANVIGTF